MGLLDKPRGGEHGKKTIGVTQCEDGALRHHEARRSIAEDDHDRAGRSGDLEHQVCDAIGNQRTVRHDPMGSREPRRNDQPEGLIFPFAAPHLQCRWGAALQPLIRDIMRAAFG